MRIRTPALGGMLAAGLLAWSGCIFENAPLSQPNAKVDERLLGTWEATTKAGQSVRLEVTQSQGDNYHMEIFLQETAAKGGESFRLYVFEGYHTDLGDLKLISLQLVEAGGRKPAQALWYFFGYAFDESGALQPSMVDYAALQSFDPDLAESGDKLAALPAKDLYSLLARARDRFAETHEHQFLIVADLPRLVRQAAAK